MGFIAFILLALFIHGSVCLLIKLWTPKKETPYYSGPIPTKEEQTANYQVIIEHLQRFPESSLKRNYPYLHDVATATRRYEELEAMRAAGTIDEIDYNLELDKILPLIKL